MLGPGRGRIWARAAVIGVGEDLNFGSPDGLKAHISGLREWLGVTSWDFRTPSEVGGGAEVRSVDPAPVHLGEFNGLDLSLQPGWEVRTEDPDRYVLLDTLESCTRSTGERDWRDHADLHMALRDLLVLSRWRHESCVVIKAMRRDDPVTSPNAESAGEKWREVVVPNGVSQSPPSDYRAHLIRFADLGVHGVQRWIQLREQYSRALDPVVSSIELGPATHSTRLAQVGPGVEALGYLLFIRDGMTRRSAKDTSLEQRLNRIAEDVDTVLPFDVTNWVELTTRTYNGVKHVNRAKPDSIDVLNAWRQCVLATRAWVALELGVGPDDVRERLSRDRQRHPYGEVT
nr:HEPN domain-containing protein [uncultured Nocardioides sp.]